MGPQAPLSSKSRTKYIKIKFSTEARGEEYTSGMSFSDNNLPFNPEPSDPKDERRERVYRFLAAHVAKFNPPSPPRTEWSDEMKEDVANMFFDDWLKDQFKMGECDGDNSRPLA